VSIWDNARIHPLSRIGQKYVTPEDIGAAIERGESKASVQQEVLEALGRRPQVCEDWSLCAFVASRYDVEAKEAAARAARREKRAAKKAEKS
jgi:hypothetical protein